MRIEFSEKTKRILASRGGYQCSYPNCAELTIGPGRSNDAVSITGVAAHIFSAAVRGPRGQGQLTGADLSALENGIWLCETHAKLIDNNRGKDFPPAVLISYKGRHEANIAKLHRGTFAPLGWFHEMRIVSGPLFRTPASIRFGKLTYIAGENSKGKSALWQWLLAVSDPAWGLSRWRRTYGQNQPLSFEVTYYTPKECFIQVKVKADESVDFLLDGRPVPIIPFDTHFLVVRKPDKADVDDLDKSKWDRWSDTQRIAYALKVDLIALENILALVGSEERRKVSKLWREPISDFVNDEEASLERERLMVALRGRESFPLPFGMLSGGEQLVVLIEIGIALASFFAEHAPTVLILEDFWAFDGANRSFWASILSSAELAFQTIVEITAEQADIQLLLKASCEVVSLTGDRPHVAIEQFGGA